MQLARLRQILTRTPVLLVAGLYLLYLLAGWLAFEPLLRWAAPKVLGSSGYQLTLERARFNPFALSVELRGLALAEPQGQQPLLQLDRLYANFELPASLFKRAYVLDQLLIERPALKLELERDGRLNWLRFVEALQDPQAPVEPPDPGAQPPRLLLRELRLSDGRIDLADQQVAGGFQTRLDPLNLELQHFSTLPEDQGHHTLSTKLGHGAELRWKGQLSLNPLQASGELQLDRLSLAKLRPYLSPYLAIAEPQGHLSLGLQYQAGYAQQQLSLQLAQLNAKLEGLALRGAADQSGAGSGLSIGTLALAGGQLDLQQRKLSLDSFSIQGGRLAATRRADGSIDLQDWIKTPAAAEAKPDPKPEPTAGPPWALELKQFKLAGLALALREQGLLQAPLRADVEALDIALQASASLGGVPQLRLQGLQTGLKNIRLRSGGEQQPWLQLGTLRLEDGQLDLAEQAFSAKRLALDGGTLQALREASGQLPLLAALQPRQSGSSAPAKPAAGPPAAGKTWHYRLDRIEAAGLQAQLRDELFKPASTLGLKNIRARLDGLDSRTPKTALPLQLALEVQEGGKLELQGKLQPDQPAADLRLKLAGLSLLPARAQLAAISDLTLVSGQLDVDGRLLYGDQQPPSFEGSFALRDLLIEERASKERFLAWKRLAARRLAASPQGLKTPLIELDGLGAKLIIHKDRTLNVVKAFHAGADKAAPETQPAAARPAAQAAGSPFKVDIGRIRFQGGEMQFADLSLALPFGTRIHDLKGHVVGLSTAPGSQARVELGGQVDAYGLASAAGTLNPADPTDAMDLKLQFKNVEMTALTPYSATFAGRRIQSGKLSLDLGYKLASRQLQGDNKIVMDKLVLGERVPGSDAPNLPLDLAIAILEDSQGRIDLGLPVSGSLDDPQFSIGGIVWKAFTGLLTKIVTAPFRALGALFGQGGEEASPDILFPPGSRELPPPEREKLDRLAQALDKRPGLAVEVAGGFEPVADKRALQDQSLRLAYAKQRGRDLGTDADPGPVGTDGPEAQKALEALFVKRFGAPALDRLRSQLQQANPDAPKPGGVAGLWSQVKGAVSAPPPPLSEPERAQLAGKTLPVEIKQRLQDSEPVDAAQLQALGRERGEAIARQLQSRGLAPERLRSQPPLEQKAGQGGSEIPIPLKLVPLQAPK